MYGTKWEDGHAQVFLYLQLQFGNLVCKGHLAHPDPA